MPGLIARIAFLVSLGAVAAGCGSSSDGGSRYSISQDRAPARGIDPDSIPEVVPGPVIRTGAGNRSPYTVLGRTYTVLPTEAGYSARGVASWYGEKFHGHKTSNGEIFDMYKASAAHRSLPIPSFLRVTNLDNNRSVVVRGKRQGAVPRRPHHRSVLWRRGEIGLRRPRNRQGANRGDNRGFFRFAGKGGARAAGRGESGGRPHGRRVGPRRDRAGESAAVSASRFVFGLRLRRCFGPPRARRHDPAGIHPQRRGRKPRFVASGSRRTRKRPRRGAAIDFASGCRRFGKSLHCSGVTERTRSDSTGCLLCCHQEFPQLKCRLSVRDFACPR